MLTLVNHIDLTDHILPSSIKIERSINQPIDSANFSLNDKAASYLIKALNQIVILDENGLANQTINMLVNPNWDVSIDSPPYPAYWQVFSTLSPAPAITFNPTSYQANTITFDASPCTAAGEFLYSQQSLYGNVVAGQTYTFSWTSTRTSLVQALAIAQLQFIDINGAVLSTFTGTASVTGTSRQSLSGLAPAGTSCAVVQFGLQVTGTTPSGTVAYSGVQLEPNMLSARGVTYPTPLCNHLQSNCYVLPNGYTVRQSRLYAGFISRSQKTYAGLKRRWQVESFSNMKLLDASYINGIFPAGMTDAQIIRSLLSQLTYAIHPVPNTPLVTTNNVNSSYVMPAMSWDNTSMLQALKDIAAITGCSYFLDDYFDLHYFPYQYSPTPFILSDQPDNVTSFAYADLMITEDASQPQNRVIVTGGTYYPTWIDPFTGDGTTTTFTLTQTTPQTILSLTVGGTAKKVGIKNTNTFAQGYDALLDTTNHQITFASAPASSAAIVVNYNFASPLRTRSWDLASIQASYGIAFEGKLDDSSIGDINSAYQAAIGQLENFAYGRNIGTLTTQKPIQPGKIVPLTSQAEGLTSAPYLIQKVAITPKGGGIVVYSADLGAYDPDLIALLKSMHQQQSSTSTLTTIAGEDITFSDQVSFTFSESSSITVKSGTTFFYGNVASLYGYSIYS